MYLFYDNWAVLPLKYFYLFYFMINYELITFWNHLKQNRYCLLGNIWDTIVVIIS